MRVLAGIYIAYVLIALLVVMPAANFLAPKYVHDTYGRKLHTDIILFNPFTFNAEVRGARLSETDGSAFAALDRASVNLSLASLFKQGVVLDEVSLQGLRLHLRRIDAETYNFSDLIPPADEEPAPESDAGIPAVTIDRLSFTAERIDLSDEARDEPFRTHYKGIDINVTDLSTIVEEGKPYRIAAHAESGGALDWEGTVSIPAARSEGTLRISELSLRPIWRFARPWLRFELREGKLSLQGDYAVSWGEGLDYDVTNGQLRLAALDIQPLDDQELADTGLSMTALTVSAVTLAGSEATVDVSEVRIDNLAVAGWSEGAQVSLAELFAMDKLPESGAETEAAPRDETGPEWQVNVADIRLQNSNVRWRSEYTDPPELLISPVEARAQAISWPFSGDSPLSLSFTINDTTQFTVDGALALENGQGNLEYSLAALPLAWFNPNLPSALKATITDGKLDTRGTISLNEFLPVTVATDGSITAFSGSMEDSEEALTRWDTVRWSQLKVNLDERLVHLDKLQIHDYEGRVHIASDGSVNASRVWQEEVGERAGEIVHDLDLDRPWQVDVPEIFISDSAIDFKDESLPIPFRTIIGDVNGSIINVSSAPGAATDVDIKGSVDGYAPVALLGSAVPFADTPELDLELTFKGVDMVLLSPYSGTYAGHSIERGLLSLDLGYSLENNRLKGNNQIVIDQLKLGDKVDSDKALDLPLELALALLTDMNGVIDLKIPVEGDVNDPQFAIGSVVAGAIVNLITKAVTAPFALLGSLVGAEEDLQRVAIPTGTAQLNEQSQEKLGLLYEALNQRPALTLVIGGQVQLDADRHALQKAALAQELIAAGVQAGEVSSRGPDYMAVIDKRYADLGTGKGLDETSFKQRNDAVLATFAVSDEQLLGLARDRAVATKEYLVNELGMPADKAVIEQAAELDGDAQAFSGVVLDVDY
ncbi:DUF748 domain-containing protein [Pseudohalioglobus lutimaris]|uniref:DUF748 domain-containing protein n=1 Tax=Pseudohalioglobus lutimaris TaxID=1737061 RepID=A0A2N5X6J6_9GAMM|nr:DUF748 domain-containing protein [Pseudohalioglobus lutimaris]